MLLEGFHSPLHILLRMKQSAMEIEEGERYNVRFVLSRRVLERLHEAIHFSTHDKRGMELLKRWFLHRTGGEVDGPDRAPTPPAEKTTNDLPVA